MNEPLPKRAGYADSEHEVSGPRYCHVIDFGRPDWLLVDVSRM